MSQIYVTYEEGGEWFKLPDGEEVDVIYTIHERSDVKFKAILTGYIIFDCVMAKHKLHPFRGVSFVTKEVIEKTATYREVVA